MFCTQTELVISLGRVLQKQQPLEDLVPYHVDPSLPSHQTLGLSFPFTVSGREKSFPHEGRELLPFLHSVKVLQCCLSSRPLPTSHRLSLILQEQIHASPETFCFSHGKHFCTEREVLPLGPSTPLGWSTQLGLQQLPAELVGPGAGLWRWAGTAWQRPTGTKVISSTQIQAIHPKPLAS